jgi:hypothetical protein
MRKLLFLLAALIAAAPVRAAWRVAESAHFIIYSEDKPESLRAFAEELERFDAAMRYLRKLEATADSHSNKLTIFQVSNVGAVQKMIGGGRGAANVYGFYNGRAGNSIAFVPRRAGSGSSWDLDAQTVLLHEYAHHFMFRNYPAAFPLWFSEGWAEFNATARFVKDGSVDLGMPAGHRAASLFYATPLPLPTLLEADRRKLNAEATDVLYGKGWLLTHYLSFNKARDGQLGAYLLAINKGRPSLAAGTEAFGDLKALDRELDRYKKGRMSYLRIPANQISIAAITLRELSPGADAIMPVMMQSRRGVDAESAKTVLKEARAAAAPYPEDPFVQLATAEAEIDAGNLAQADKAADLVLKAEPANVRALIYKGRVAIARLTEADKATAEDWKMARRWFTRANRAEPGAPEPLIHFYTSFAAEGEKPTPNAVEGLRAAIALAAEDDGLRLMLGRQMLVDGKGEDARAALAPVAYHPHGGGLAEFAGRVVAAIDKGGTEAGLKAWSEKPEETKPEKMASR